MRYTAILDQPVTLMNGESLEVVNDVDGIPTAMYKMPSGKALAFHVAFTCPRCNMTSHNINDIKEGYCGNCHDWTGK